VASSYRVSLNSTYFDIYLFTRSIPRAFNQPTITVGSEQRNVFKNIRSPDRFVRSPFEVIECRWPPRKFSREVKISVVMCIRTDMSTVQNYSISRKVSSDTFISRSLKGLSYGWLYGTATPHIPKREVKIMRGTALWTVRLLGLDGKERLRDESDDKALRDTAGWEWTDVSNELHYFYEYWSSSLIVLLKSTA